MKEIVFEISEAHEEKLTGFLNDTGFTSFYFEKTRNSNLLKLYIDDGDIPIGLKDEKLISISVVEPSSWNRIWGENYRGEELTENIFVLPAGAAYPEKKYKTLIAIDPYDSFGDGHHPTTRLCGMLLEEVIRNYYINVFPGKLSMLDIGTGSGILAIAAWTMGVRDIEMFDYDPVAVAKALKNLRLNGIDTFSPFNEDIYKFSSTKKYNIITANLLSRIIEDNIGKLISLLKPEGILIVSGVNTIWTEDIKKIFYNNNISIIKHVIIDEWNGFILGNF